MSAIAYAAASERLPEGERLQERSVAPVNSFVPMETANSRVDQGRGVLKTEYRAAKPFQLSDAAALALGDAGRDRLERFRALHANWDGAGAQPLSSQSLEAFSQFFRDSGLRPTGMAVFMSPDGNIAVNWVEGGGALVELEFVGTGVHYFFEASDEEGIDSAYGVAARLTLELPLAA
jgi:hypothetical protein